MNTIFNISTTTMNACQSEAESSRSRLFPPGKKLLSAALCEIPMVECPIKDFFQDTTHFIVTFYCKQSKAHLFNQLLNLPPARWMDYLDGLAKEKCLVTDFDTFMDRI